MNIAKKLEEPQKLTKADALEIAAYASGAAVRFKELLQCMLVGGKDYRLCQRAAWCVSLVAKHKPALIYPHLATLVEQLGHQKTSHALIRNCLRILRDVEIPASLHEKTVYYCFEYAGNPLSPIAIRAFALQILGHIALVIPDIRTELLELIAFHYDGSAAAFKSSARMVRKLLGENLIGDD